MTNTGKFTYEISNFRDCDLDNVKKELDNIIENELFKFADYISNYFEDPSLYCNPSKLIEMYKQYANN